MIRNYLQLARQQPGFLLFGLLTACLSSFGQTFYIGLFSDDIRTGFNLSHGEYGLFYSLATLASGFTLLWAGRLVDRLDLRWITSLTVLVLALAATGMGLINHALLLIPVFFLLRLAGQGMMGHIAVTAMGRYFAGSRGRAISVAAMGFPLGEAIFPAVAIALMATVGWQITWQFAGMLLGLMGLPLLLLLLRGHGRRHRAWQLRQQRLSRHREGDDGSQWPLHRVLKEAGFWGLMPVVLSPAFFVTGFFFHQGGPGRLEAMAAGVAGNRLCSLCGYPNHRARGCRSSRGPDTCRPVAALLPAAPGGGHGRRVAAVRADVDGSLHGAHGTDGGRQRHRGRCHLGGALRHTAPGSHPIRLHHLHDHLHGSLTLATGQPHG